MEILILIFVNWCFTTGIVNSSLIDPIRNYFLVKYPPIHKLLSCVRCLGFWVGFITFGYSTYSGDINQILWFPLWLNFLIFPFVQSASGVILENFIIFMGKISYININNGRDNE